MKIKVWGSRGSTSMPGQSTLRYGGNTTCLEIRTSRGQLIVVDAGTGLRNFGKCLVQTTNPTEIVVVFTHLHWDHLSGFPFFAPIYLPNYKISLCSGHNTRIVLEKLLSHQMESPFFPVNFNRLQAAFDFDGKCFDEAGAGRLPGIGSLECQAIPLNHPDGGYGFKFVDQGKSFVLLTDNELGFHHPGGRDYKEYVEFCQGADLLFHDAQYTGTDYRQTRGWGHSTFADATELAMEAGVKRLGFFHHDPDRTDDDLDRQIVACREQLERAGSPVQCLGVSEGMTLAL